MVRGTLRLLRLDEPCGGEGGNVLDRMGMRAAQELVENHPETVDVARRADVVGLAGALLGAHVEDRADQLAFGRGFVGPGQVGIGEAGDAEIDDLGVAPRVDQQVGRLQVAVDDALFVPECDPVTEAGDELDAGSYPGLPVRRTR